MRKYQNDSEQAKQDLINLINQNNHALLDDYINSHTSVRIDFKCGHKPHLISPTNYKAGKGCPKCANEKVAKIKIYHSQKKCVALTHPQLIHLFANPNDAKNYSIASNRTAYFKCPNCQNIIKAIVSNVFSRRLSCKKCGDGVSYPEKFMQSVLKQLNIEFNTNQKFDWSDNRLYDFHLPNFNIIIETHGEQHYIGRKDGRSFIEEQENDEYKEQLAIGNGIDKYIALDFRYSRLEWCKDNLLNSPLNDMFDLSNIDWIGCHKYACNSNIIKASKLWNNQFSLSEIANDLKVTNETVTTYLIQGLDANLNNYTKKEAKRRGHANNVGANNNKSRASICLSKRGKLISRYDSLTDALKVVDASIFALYNACEKNSNKPYNEPFYTSAKYIWLFEEDYNKLADTDGNISYLPKRVHIGAKAVIQLTKDDETFIARFDSASEGAAAIDGDIRNVSAALNGKRPTAYGFKWVFEEDYNKAH